MSAPPEILEQALADWRDGRAYIDDKGSYHVGEHAGAKGPVAPWNKAVKKAYPTSTHFHHASHGRVYLSHADALADLRALMGELATYAGGQEAYTPVYADVLRTVVGRIEQAVLTLETIDGRTVPKAAAS